MLDEETVDLELITETEINGEIDDFDSKFTSFLHHETPMVKPKGYDNTDGQQVWSRLKDILTWWITVISGLINAVLGFLSVVSYAQSHIYYFDLGYVFASTCA